MSIYRRLGVIHLGILLIYKFLGVKLIVYTSPPPRAKACCLIQRNVHLEFLLCSKETPPSSVGIELVVTDTKTSTQLTEATETFARNVNSN